MKSNEGGNGEKKVIVRPEAIDFLIIRVARSVCINASDENRRIGRQAMEIHK